MAARVRCDRRKDEGFILSDERKLDPLRPSLPPYSPSCRGALQGKEGDVVFLLPTLPYEGVEFLQEKVPQRSFLTVLGYECPKPRETKHLTLRIVSFYQPIAVEQDALAPFE